MNRHALRLTLIVLTLPVLALLLPEWSAPVTAGEPRWIRIQSDNFEFNTTSGERSARDTVLYFEQVRGFFLQVLGNLPDKNPLPVSIVAFNSVKEYEPFRLNSFATAFYRPGTDRDFIVLSNTGSDVFPVAVHEYVHLLCHHAGLDFPPWLNEGFADLYSTLKPSGDKILVGTPPLGRVRAIQQQKWVPLTVILNTDRQSPYYNEKTKAGSFYAESWALTHMLMLGDEYRKGFDKLINAILDKKPSEQALVEVYGKPLAKIESDVQAYVRRDTVPAVLFPTKLKKITGQVAVQAVPPFDVRLRLAELSNRRDNDAQVRKLIDEAIADQPQRPESYVVLGYLAWRGRQTPEATAQFHKAFELGSRSPKMLWDYGRLLPPNNAEKLAVFKRLLQDQPNRVDVRIEIASLQSRARQFQEALATLQEVTAVSREDAPHLFRLLMNIEMGNGNRDGAKKAAGRLLQVSNDERDKDDAERLIKLLESGAEIRPQVREAAVVSLPAEETRPTLRRSGNEESSVAQEEPVRQAPSVSGSFVELLCANSQATVVLRMPSGDTRRFLIDKPGQVMVRRPEGGPAELACGKQPPTIVRIEYELPVSGVTGVAGLVRVLEFEK